MADYFYAVRIGRVPGVYKSWAECSEQVFKFPGAKYKKFSTLSLAQEFISQAHHSGIQNPNYESHNLVKKTREKKSKKEKTKAEMIENIKNGIKEVYTDGACPSNGRPEAKASIGIYFPRFELQNGSEFRNESELQNGSEFQNGLELQNKSESQGERFQNVSEIVPKDYKQTNQVAELYAIKRVLEILPKDEQWIIYTDSMYSINCITVWYKKWEKNNYENVKNSELIKIIVKNKGKHVFRHVPGHNGIYGNEQADKLANQAFSLI